MGNSRIVIVGGSDAGIAAALSARGADAGCAIDVLLEDAFPNFSVCGLPFLVSGEVDEASKLAHRPEQTFVEKGIVVRKRHRALHVDPHRREVLVESPTGRSTIGYDRLIFATGAEPVMPDIPGADLPGVLLMRTMSQGLDVTAALAQRKVERVAVVGGGYLGTELVDAFTRRGLQVCLLESSDRPLKTLDAELGQVVARELERQGVAVVSNTRLEAIRERGERGGTRLHLLGTGGFETTVDLVVVATGVRPNTALARQAGCALGAGGAVAVSRTMETNVESVLAAGDCVQTWHRVLGKAVYLPLGTTAHKQGAVAGANAVGGRRAFEGSLGTQVVKIFDLAAARTGLLDGEALAAGFEPRTVQVVVPDHKVYYPGHHELRIRITGDDRDGRLIGAQMLGDHRAAVAKRIDVVAAALFAGLRVRDLLDLDLSYTPPLGSPWDPVQEAAAAWCDTSCSDR
jgi:NADPH-dependent 2,4-dienoyl-CoA reductase/sulfur reductase-like enzyme